MSQYCKPVLQLCILNPDLSAKRFHWILATTLPDGTPSQLSCRKKKLIWRSWKDKKPLSWVMPISGELIPLLSSFVFGEGIILILCNLSDPPENGSMKERRRSRMAARSWCLPSQAELQSLITCIYGKSKWGPACSSNSYSTWSWNMLRQWVAKVIWLVSPKLLCEADGRNLWLSFCQGLRWSW